ncbi:MAG: aldose epimerase family protein [Acidobacteriota bacterium]
MTTYRKSIGVLSLAVLTGFFVISCQPGKPAADETTPAKGQMMDIQKEAFGRLEDGTTVDIFTLTNPNGLRARLMTYGATLVSLEVPDKEGQLGDIVLGMDTIEGYIQSSPYFGCIVGRYGNRIAKGKFRLDGEEYTLAVNNNENHLHGGVRGFDKVVWNAEEVWSGDDIGIRFAYTSPDGEEGYPGNLTVTVIYTLTANDELKIDYEAETDKATPVNLTHHSYFNLAGQGRGDILRHKLKIYADSFTPVDGGLIPTGEIKAVAGTPWDFNIPHDIGKEITKVAGGYDHNYVLNKEEGDELSPAAEVYEPTTGRVMEILTTEPGIQFYSGNFLNGAIIGKSGKVYFQHFGFCLETQHFPDSPNKPEFPSTILRPGETYKTQTIHKFSTRK